MSYTTLILAKNDGIAKITLNRPEAMNALSSQLEGELCEAVVDVQRDDEIAVLILTGTGRAFCAGRDLKEMGQTMPPTRTPSPWELIRELEKPTIAAVNGHAITGGFELVLACDIIIASENARFADTHARLGLLPGQGLSQVLPRLVGTKKAKEISFAGNFVGAEEALRIGLVNRVVSADSLQATAEALARDIVGSNQIVVRKMKKLIDRGEGLPIEAALALERAEQLTYRQSLKAADIEERRQGVMERGRAQTGPD